MPIRGVLFDADGVLQHASEDLHERLQRALGFLPEPVDAFMQDCFRAERPSLVGEGDFARDLLPVVERWGAPAEKAVDLSLCWCSIDADQRILDLVGELRAAGYVCALATNQQAVRAGHMRRELGYDELFDHQFYSCELGVRKPDPRYFQAIVRTLPFAAPELVFVDDSRPNVAAARSMGLSAAHFVHGRNPDARESLVALLRGLSVELGG